MRAQARRGAREEEEESAFVSMTDMTVGFLFIIMLLMVFFASQVHTQDVVPRSIHEVVVQERDKWQQIAVERAARIMSLEEEIERLNDIVEKQRLEIEELKALLAQLQQVDPLEGYLADIARVRRAILEQLRAAMKAEFPDLAIELSEESDALRFQGEGLFASNARELTAEKAAIVSSLARKLDEVLPCFTKGPSSGFSVACNPDYVMIEAVQIEGHTDNTGPDSYNRILSTDRANSTFFQMTGTVKNLLDHRNLKDQPVLSVAAYGEDRPVAENNSEEGRATNRRIDLRFIMVTPQSEKGIAIIRRALEQTGEED